MGRGDGTEQAIAPAQRSGPRFPKRFYDDGDLTDQQLKANYDQYLADKLNYRELTQSSEVSQLAAVLREQQVTKLAVDFETARGEGEQFGVDNGRLRLVQIGVCHPAFNGYRQWIIDCDQADPRALNPIFADNSIAKIIHYSPFEHEWAMVHLGAKIYNVWDTCFASQSINKEFGRWLDDPDKGMAAIEPIVAGWRRQRPEEKPNSLGTQIHRYMGIAIPKEDQTSDWGKEQLSDDQKVYAAVDVIAPLDLEPGLKQIAEAQKISGRIDWRCGKARQEVVEAFGPQRWRTNRAYENAEDKLAPYKWRSHQLAWKMSWAEDRGQLDDAWQDGKALLTGIGWPEREQLIEFYEQQRQQLP